MKSEAFIKTKHAYTLWPNNSTPRFIANKNVYIYIH